jgi:anti-sigma B factor antagonist
MRIDIGPYGSTNGFYTITPHGPIDSTTYVELQTKTNLLLKEGTLGIVADLAHVDYISSAGLGVLFTLKKWLKSKGGDLYFLNVQPKIKKLFEIVKALPAETLFESYEEADKYFYRMLNDGKEKL